MFLALPTLKNVTGGGFVSKTFKTAALDLNFAGTQSLTDSISKSNLVTFSRSGSGATYIDSTGTLQTASANSPRFTYDPTTLQCQGLLLEESRTNSIRNNTMVGAVAGTPGTVPNNWALTTGTINGVTRTIVGTGTESGITYIDIQYAGTAITGGSINISAELNNQIAAAQNQVWAFSCYMKLVAGSFANVATQSLFINSYTAAGAYDANSASYSSNYPVGGPTTAALNTQKYYGIGTLGSATAAFVNSGIFITYNASAVINFTLRIGLPQLEQGAFATSVIPTSTAAATRSADVVSITGSNFSSWYNGLTGTLFTDASISYTLPSTSFPLVGSLNDGTTTNRMENGFLTSTLGGFEVVAGGVTQAALYPSNSALSRKLAGAYSANDFAASVNGGTTLTDVAGSVPVVDRLFIGSRTGIGPANILSGTIKRLTYWNTRLPNTTLQALTT